MAWLGIDCNLKAWRPLRNAGQKLPENVEMAVLELLCSRLCHDLVGPVGAVNNGLELVEEDPSSLDDIMPLLTSSTRQAWKRLDFFRIAFGFGGGRSSWPYAELRRVSDGYLEESKAKLDWQLHGQDLAEAEGRRGKLLLNLVALGAECLPRGGTVSVEVPPSTSGWRLLVTASGTGANLHERSALAIRGRVSVEDLDARAAQPYFTWLLAEQLGGGIRYDEAPDRRAFSVETP